MKYLRTIFLLVSASSVAVLVGCGGSSKTPVATVPVAVTMGTTPAALFVNDTTPVTATVTNDSASAGVTWSCAPSGTCGTFSAAQTPSGTATTYTAPAAVPASTVVITATSVTDTTKSASSPAITINAASGIAVVLSTPPPTAMAPSATATIGATVTGDTAAAGVTWSCTPASTCGSFSSSQTASAATTVYTAPSTTGNVVITATSVTDDAQFASATVTVTSAASNTLAPGNYVFSSNGADPYSVTGVFTVTAGGVITGGEQDFINASGAVHDAITSGTFAASTDGNLIITLTTADTGIGVAGVETLDASLVSSSNALITEFDTSATSSGTLDLQTSLAAPSGGYAFSVFGVDSAAFPVGVGGVINVDSVGAISGAGSVFDINDGNGSGPLQDQTFTASTVSTPDSLGLVTITLNPSVASAVPQIVLVGYIVDATHIRLVETTDTFAGTMGGTALGQGTNVGTFATSSISGTSLVFGSAGFDVNGALQVAGVLTANSDGTTVSGNLSFNELTTQSPQGGVTLTAGTYTVDATGRVTLTGLTDGATFTYTLQLYLAENGEVLVLSMDASDVVGGLGFSQSGTFTAASFAGSYVLNAAQVVAGNEYDGVGPVAADGIGSLSGFIDLNEFLVPVSDLPLSGTFAAGANGVFTGSITGIDSTAVATADNFTYYLVDTTRVVAIENDTDQLTLGYFVLQQ
jgi:hypothetical protein